MFTLSKILVKQSAPPSKPPPQPTSSKFASLNHELVDAPTPQQQQAPALTTSQPTSQPVKQVRQLPQPGQKVAQPAPQQQPQPQQKVAQPAPQQPQPQPQQKVSQPAPQQTQPQKETSAPGSERYIME